MSKYDASVTDMGGVTFNTPTFTNSGQTKLVSSRRQCGEYVNDAIGYKLVGDSLASKSKYATESVPTPGGAFVLANNQYGHIGMIEDTDGKVPPDRILISESNFDGKESFRRTWTTMAALKSRGLVGFTPALVGDSAQRGSGKSSAETPAGFSAAPKNMFSGKNAIPKETVAALKSSAQKISSQITNPIQSFLGKLSPSKKDAYDTLLNL